MRRMRTSGERSEKVRILTVVNAVGVTDTEGGETDTETDTE